MILNFQVDIFAHDIIVVPIHLEVHWCMSILDMKNKTAYYYDSMLANNSYVLKVSKI
jgi:sentrin-specific protease 1